VGLGLGLGVGVGVWWWALTLRKIHEKYLIKELSYKMKANKKFVQNHDKTAF
jgi:hypothetical protein